MWVWAFPFFRFEGRKTRRTVTTFFFLPSCCLSFRLFLFVEKLFSPLLLSSSTTHRAHWRRPESPKPTTAPTLPTHKPIWQTPTPVFYPAATLEVETDPPPCQQEKATRRRLQQWQRAELTNGRRSTSRPSRAHPLSKDVTGISRSCGMELSLQTALPTSLIGFSRPIIPLVRLPSPTRPIFFHLQSHACRQAP